MKFDERYIIINLNDNDNYLKKTYDVLYKKFSDNLFLLSEIKTILIFINGNVEHICSLHINSNNIFPKFYIIEDNYNINDIDENEYVKLYNNFRVGNVACQYLLFDFSKEKEFDNINFISKFYNTNYSIASIAYKILDKFKDDKTTHNLKLIIKNGNKCYVDSRIIKIVICILSNLILNKIFQIEDAEVANIINVIGDILIILIKDGKIIIFDKKYYNTFKKELKRHIKEMQKILKKKSCKKKLKKFLIDIIKGVL